MSQDFLEYDKLMEHAVRSVVREVLERTAANGLPGAHHFYITFRTDVPGVEMSQVLFSKHPEEMTIVLENKFWGLEVGEESFTVNLSFAGAQECLVIPFDALTAFVDPSVKFGLQFGHAITEATISSLTPTTGQPDNVAGRIESGDGNTERPDEDGPDDDGPGGARVVALDTFRKK